MCLCYTARNGKTDTGARTWLLGGKERIENAAADFVRDTRTSVADRDLHQRPHRARRHADLPRWRRALQCLPGVHDEVRNHVMQLVRVAARTAGRPAGTSQMSSTSLADGSSSSRRSTDRSRVHALTGSRRTPRWRAMDRNVETSVHTVRLPAVSSRRDPRVPIVRLPPPPPRAGRHVR